MSLNTGIAPEQVRTPVCTAVPANGCDAHAGGPDLDEEVTLTMRADEKKKLIETAFGDEQCLDDEITIDRTSPLPPSSQRLPTPKMLVIAPPPPSRPQVTSKLAQAARELLHAEDVHRRDLARQRKTQIWLLAGIWAMALSLVVMLALMVNNA